MKKIKNKGGFTLVELMVAMVISSFVVAGIYGVYTIQQRSYTVQEQVSEMQQRLRAAVQFVTGEMRMAGYDPPNNYPDPNPYDPGGVCDGSTISTAEKDKLVFEYCRVENVLNSSGSPKNPPEYTSDRIQTTYTYKVDDKELAVDHSVNGGTGSERVLAEGIEAVEFLYLDKDENTATDPADIRTIKISILARSTYPDRKYTDKTLYKPASGIDDWDLNGSESGIGNPPNDHYHRRLLITTVKLRNMGLEQ